MSKLVSELSFSWKGTFGKKSQPKIWGVSLLCLMWSIWRETSASIFEGMLGTSIEVQILGIFL